MSQRNNTCKTADTNTCKQRLTFIAKAGRLPLLKWKGNSEL
jgi:hypothetical protein